MCAASTIWATAGAVWDLFYRLNQLQPSHAYGSPGMWRSVLEWHLQWPIFVHALCGDRPSLPLWTVVNSLYLEHLQTSLFGGFIYGSSVNIILGSRKKFFKFELHRSQPCWFTPCQWRAEKGWLMTHCTLVLVCWPILGANITDLVRIAALMAVFPWLSNVNFLTDYNQFMVKCVKSNWKTAVNVVFLMFC